MSKKICLVTGALFGFLSVLTGAFAAHALKPHLSPQFLEIFQLASRYLFFHGVALLLVGVLLGDKKNPFVFETGLFFILGTFIFSGSLFIYTLSSIKFFAMITPIGGMLLLWAWLSFAINLSKRY